MNLLTKKFISSGFLLITKFDTPQKISIPHKSYSYPHPKRKYPAPIFLPLCPPEKLIFLTHTPKGRQSKNKCGLNNEDDINNENKLGLSWAKLKIS